jgi:hypothetical protein
MSSYQPSNRRTENSERQLQWHCSPSSRQTPMPTPSWKNLLIDPFTKVLWLLAALEAAPWATLPQRWNHSLHYRKSPAYGGAQHDIHSSRATTLVRQTMNSSYLTQYMAQTKTLDARTLGYHKFAVGLSAAKLALCKAAARAYCKGNPYDTSTNLEWMQCAVALWKQSFFKNWRKKFRLT